MEMTSSENLIYPSVKQPASCGRWQLQQYLRWAAAEGSIRYDDVASASEYLNNHMPNEVQNTSLIDNFKYPIIFFLFLYWSYIEILYPQKLNKKCGYCQKRQNSYRESYAETPGIYIYIYIKVMIYLGDDLSSWLILTITSQSDRPQNKTTNNLT